MTPLGNKRFGKWLMAKRREAKLSREEAAAGTWYGPNQWALVEQGKMMAGGIPLEAMARNIGVEKEEIYRQAGYINSVSVQQACYADPDICSAIRILVHRRDDYRPGEMLAVIEAVLERDIEQVEDGMDLRDSAEYHAAMYRAKLKAGIFD